MKISVIIPVYNAEKYLGVCLESLLIQTFTDFEVIVVDDCSTDSSPTVAESYLERFGGRLKIITLPQNTGSGAVPRNEGLKFSRGEYIYFVDSDDFVVDDALETLYGFAEEYRADVVYMEKFFLCDERPVPESLNPVDWLPDLSDDEIMFESDDLEVRVEKFSNKKFFCSPWSKFLRRQFLIDNAITFPQTKIAEDFLWSFKIVCLSKKFLRIPSRIYVQRNNMLSISRRKRSPEQQLKLYANPMMIVAELFEDFMSNLEFFRRNPDRRLQIQMFFVKILLRDIESDLIRLTPAQVYEIFLREFSAAGSSHPALIACLFVMMNIYYQTLKEKENS